MNHRVEKMLEQLAKLSDETGLVLSSYLYGDNEVSLCLEDVETNQVLAQVRFDTYLGNYVLVR